MRRWIATVVIGLVLAALAGCSAPAGVDGDLTNNWPAMPEPTVRVPVAGDCWTTKADLSIDVTTATTALVDSCSLPHQTETVHAGQFPSAAGAAVPAADSPAMRDAYSDCAAAAKEYLGGDWYDALVDLVVLPPSDKQWAVGARYYRCDVVSIRTYRHDLVTAHASARNGLRGQHPLAVGCVDVTRTKAGALDTVDPADCASSHSGEYAGTYLAPAGPYPTSLDTRRQLGLNGCQKVVARFLGVSAPISRTDVAWLSTGFVQERWGYGDRGDRCFAMAYNSAKKTTGSIKGLGGKPLPK